MQNSISKYLTTVSRSIIWWLFAHAVSAKQRVSKLSHYYPNAYSRIADAKSKVKDASIRNETLTNRQKTLNLGVFLQHNYGWCSYATAGRFRNTYKLCNISFHPLTQIQKLCCSCKNSIVLRLL